MNTVETIGVLASVASLALCFAAPSAGVIALLFSLLLFAVGRMLKPA